jgi:hypothetical protein
MTILGAVLALLVLWVLWKLAITLIWAGVCGLNRAYRASGEAKARPWRDSEQAWRSMRRRARQ